MTIEEIYQKVGGDYKDALGRLMNDKLIARFLSKFRGSDYLQPIQSAYAKKDYKAVFEAAHALKGVAGNLSLTSIFLIASEITEATRNLKEGEEVSLEDQIARLTEIYQLTIVTIQNAGL